MNSHFAESIDKDIERRRMQLLQRFYDNYFSEDDAFDEMVQPFLVSATRVLDAGCGDGTITQYNYRERVKLIVGVDIEGDLKSNANVDVVSYADLGRLPFSEDSFDLVICRYVVEHLRDPVQVFREFHRILADEGTVVIHGPNRYHYAQIAAQLIPDRLHGEIIRYLCNRESFPKHHRANSRRQLVQLMHIAGLEPIKIVMFESAPDYLAFATPAYVLGVVYERLVNRFDVLADFRLNIIASFRKIGKACGGSQG